MASEKRVFVYASNRSDSHRQFIIEGSHTLAMVKKMIAKKLRQPVEALYLSGGAEVRLLDSVAEDAKLFCRYEFDESKENEFAVAIFGDGGVGKSAIVQQLLYTAFSDSHDPTINDEYSTELVVDRTPATVKILDTAGQWDYTNFWAEWMANKHGLLFVYDVTNRATFDGLQEFLDLYAKLYKERNVPFMLVGNKKDIADSATSSARREVTKAEAQRLATRAGRNDKGREAYYSCIETSALTGENVLATFEFLIRAARQSRQARQSRFKGQGRRKPPVVDTCCCICS